MPPPLHHGRAVRIHYITQAATRPPTFILWANTPDGLAPSYKRFIANRLRERYGFRGTPIRIFVKAKKDRHDRGDASHMSSACCAGASLFPARRRSAALRSGSMIRASLLLALVLAACGGDAERHIVDGNVDAPADAPVDSPVDGAGSASLAMIEPHPHDNKLELLVAGLSVVVVLGPLAGARKRRDNV